MASRIEQIIEEIEEYLDSCKFQPLSTTKIVVNKEELEELLRELRLKTPEEIRRYQRIISNKDAILADAQAKADGIIASAEATAKKMTSEHEVMQQAYTQANDTINKANRQAQDIVDTAIEDAKNYRHQGLLYTDDQLANLGNIIGTTIEETGARYKALMQELENAYEIVRQNREQLAPSLQDGQEPVMDMEDESEESYDDSEIDDYNDLDDDEE